MALFLYPLKTTENIWYWKFIEEYECDENTQNTNVNGFSNLFKYCIDIIQIIASKKKISETILILTMIVRYIRSTWDKR